MGRISIYIICILLWCCGCSGKNSTGQFNGTINRIPGHVVVDIAKPYEFASNVTCKDIKDPSYCREMPISFSSDNYVNVENGELISWITETWSEIYGGTVFPKDKGKLYYIEGEPAYGYCYNWYLSELKESSLFQAELRSLKQSGISVPTESFHAFIVSLKVDSHHKLILGFILPVRASEYELNAERLQTVMENSLFAHIKITIKK